MPSTSPNDARVSWSESPTSKTENFMLDEPALRVRTASAMCQLLNVICCVTDRRRERRTFALTCTWDSRGIHAPNRWWTTTVLGLSDICLYFQNRSLLSAAMQGLVKDA